VEHRHFHLGTSMPFREGAAIPLSLGACASNVNIGCVDHFRTAPATSGMPHLLHRLKFPENGLLFGRGSPEIPSFSLINIPVRHAAGQHHDAGHRNMRKNNGKDVCKGMRLTRSLFK
jgi:hypothetical protein